MWDPFDSHHRLRLSLDIVPVPHRLPQQQLNTQQSNPSTFTSWWVVSQCVAYVVVMSEREEWDEIPEDQYTRGHRLHYVGIKRNVHIEQQKKKKNNQLKGVGREKKNHINYLCELALLCCYFFNIFSVIIDIFIIYTRVRLNPMNSLLDV